MLKLPPWWTTPRRPGPRYPLGFTVLILVQLLQELLNHNKEYLSYSVEEIRAIRDRESWRGKYMYLTITLFRYRVLIRPQQFHRISSINSSTVQGSSVRFIIGEADFQATVGGAILAAKSGWPQRIIQKRSVFGVLLIDGSQFFLWIWSIIRRYSSRNVVWKSCWKLRKFWSNRLEQGFWCFRIPGSALWKMCPACTGLVARDGGHFLLHSCIKCEELWRRVRWFLNVSLRNTTDSPWKA